MSDRVLGVGTGPRSCVVGHSVRPNQERKRLGHDFSGEGQFVLSYMCAHLSVLTVSLAINLPRVVSPLELDALSHSSPIS